MIFWTILILVIGVVGWRDYYKDYENIYKLGINLCPELHVHIPDMHPHQCVSYAEICKGVQKVEAKIALNGTQYLCHNRFQPWGAGTPTVDNVTFHCGFQNGVSLQFQKQNDEHFLVTCVSTTDLQNCLISVKLNLSYCLFCKPPRYGKNCSQTNEGWDGRYTEILRQCPSSCKECNQDRTCTKCRSGHINWIYSGCEIDCQGEYCFFNSSGTLVKSGACVDGCGSTYPSYLETCKRCHANYALLRQQLYPEIVDSCYDFPNCMGNYKVISTKLINQQYEYVMECSQCDLGHLYNNQSLQCRNSNETISNCLFINETTNTCYACLPWHGLQSDGTCQSTICSSNCQTCLDTNPQFCTSCDGKNGKTLFELGGISICICKPNYGLQLDACLSCIDGYCQSCEQYDFLECTDCKPGSNRILVNKQCICQQGTFDPESEDQICIACDQSCLNCKGLTKSECTECMAESISNRIQIGTFCPCKPGYGEYEIREKTCGKCHPRCQTCFQAADGTQNQYCFTCIPGQNRVISDMFNCDCKDNYGDLYGTKEICQICDYTCGSCNYVGPTHCTQCLQSSYRYLTTSGECLCIPSYFDDNTENIECQQCHYSCLLCANSSEKGACLSCPQTREPSDPLATNFQCLCISSSTFDDGFYPTCPQCDQTCLTCNGPLSSNCLTCDPTYRQLALSSCVCPIGHYDIGQLQCEQCHFSCNQCFDNTAEGCIDCSLENHLRTLKGNSCKCQEGSFEEPGLALCKKCSYKCETCEIQPDNCLSCPLNSIRLLNTLNECQCPQEFYDAENIITCQKCHFKCKTCNAPGEESCLSCDQLLNRQLQFHQCKCQPHYFEMEVEECSTCSSFCYECVTHFQNCTSCYNDRYLLEGTCKCISKFEGSAISTFEFNGMVKCQKCHYSCGTCRGFQVGDCISCIDTDRRTQVGNICVCIEGYYDAGLPVCEKCSYKCKGCMKQSDICVSCQDNSLRNFVSGFNRCQCIQRYYDDGQNEVCQKCHYSCLRCNEIDRKCELCSIESNRIFNSILFTCGCDVGYYDAGVEICQKCHYSCLSCKSGDANSCVTCLNSSQSNRVPYNNTCKCLFGYFDDGQSISCKECDIQCLSCTNQSYSCLSCPQTRKIENNCQCLQGYYDVGLQLCQKCNSSCMTCEFTLNNCSSCYTNQFREINLITKTCDCQLGYLEINGICQQCYSSCKTCLSNLNQCTSCAQFRHLKINNCICNDGMYESITDKQCKLCDKSCLTCDNSNTFCLTCSIENFRQITSGNICDCIQGYYEDPLTQNCEQCSNSCLTCILLYDNCLTCDSSLNLSLINNKCLCSSSYFFDSQSKSCQQCNSNCLECENSNVCISCRLTTRYLDQGLQKCLCITGYYEINQQNCQQCHFSCENCENSHMNCLTCMDQSNRILTNNNCLCIDGYYEAGIEICQKCSNICKTCILSASTCQSCYELEQNRYFSEDKCQCQIGYFDSNAEICSKCSNECLTCKGQPDYCTSCDNNARRVDQSIIHKCPCIIGFFQDQNQICQKCHIKCQTCINQSDQCLSCHQELNSNRKSLFDQCNCMDGYFDDGTQFQCQKCNFKCKTCVNEPNNCLICQTSIRIIPPICNCMDGYYEDEQLTCQICASQCNTCELQPSNCLTCKPGRIGLDCKCMDGYFEIGLMLCQQCASQCAVCEFDPLNCKTCKGNRIMEPQCICQSGYFDDQLNIDCQKCNSTCLECNQNGCSSCIANRILKEQVCIPPPNSISYDTTPWCSTCQVAVVKAQLSNDISKIIIHFDFKLNPKSFNQQFEVNMCLQIFEQESVKQFGQNSVCNLNPDDNQELLITLGENSKFNVGDEILFKINSLSHINCETSLQKFILTTLQMPNFPLSPQIEYHVPLYKLNPFIDNQVHVKSIKNKGNRKLENINWSCQVETTEDSSQLNDFLDQINFQQEFNLLIPKFTLQKSSVFTFKIYFENFIHINSYSEFTIQTHAGDLPQININVKPSYFVYEFISIGLSAYTLDKSNQIDNSTYEIQVYEINRFPKESLSSQLNISFKSNPYEIIYANIKNYILSPNSTYTFQVIATNLNTNITQQQNFTIEISLAGLYCQFSNKGIQNIRKDLNLQIQCEDFNTIFKQNMDPDLYIQVTCLDLSQNSQCKNEQKQILNINQTETVQFIKKNSISPYTVQEWTVNVTKFQQTSKFVLIVVYLEDDFPPLELEFNKGYLMRKINNYEQLNFTFLIPLSQKSNLLDLSIAIVYDFQIIEILRPNYISHSLKIFNSIKELNFGDNINLNFAAQYTNNIMPSLNNLKLTINQPPLCSKLFITRESDLALTNLIVATTCEQSTDSPYKYQLRLFLQEQDLTQFLEGSSDNSLILHSFQNLNQFSIQIPTSVNNSKIGILLQVLDNGGSITNVFDKITPKPAILNCSQIQFKSLNLQKKISLLFEALNQKCHELHQKIYDDMLYELILPNKNDNFLKLQAMKQYKRFLISSASVIPKNRLLNEQTKNKNSCYDLNSTHLFITQNFTETGVNLTNRIEDLKENTHKLDMALQYFSNMKKDCEEELNLNFFVQNYEIFQQYQDSQDGLINLLYYLDEIYSNFSSINTRNDTIYNIVLELLRFTTIIVEEIQNTVVVNDKPKVCQGNEIIWQIKRRTKQFFNQQFNIEPIQEDYLLDFIQYQSTYLQTNPLRFAENLDKILQQQFNDQSMKIYSRDYYQIFLKNVYHNRFLTVENFSSIYRTNFGSYQTCSNNNSEQLGYQMYCVVKTASGQFHLCNLVSVQKDDNVELNCECTNFGDIFLTSSTNFTNVTVNNTKQQIFNLNVASTPEDILPLRIATSAITLMFIAIYIYNLYKDCKNQQERLETESSGLSPPQILDKNSLIYQGNTKIFKEKFKQIHQTISIFYYRDKNIQLSFRILEIFSQFNLLLALAILECYLVNTKLFFILVFIIVNPFIILIFRIFYKIIESLYRFKRIAAAISQFILILLLLAPNSIVVIFYLMKISLQSEQYIILIIFLGNITISQCLIEPLTILGRIVTYRQIASSLKNMDLNPIYHFLHFFIMHGCLEEIFQDFTRI